MLRLLALGLLAFATTTQADTTSPPAPESACKQPEYHQFDFWIGEWNVTEQIGRPARVASSPS